MAESKSGIPIPPQSITYMLLCLSGILIFIFGGIVPAYKTIAELGAQTADVKYRLEEQQALAPFYQSLRDSSEKKASEVLPLPAKGKLPLNSLNTLPIVFNTAARTSGMSLVSAIPNLGALTGDTQFLSVNAILRGNFIDFRNFLIAVGGIPYVTQIEEISIQQKPDAKEFRLKIWVAVG